MRFGFFWVYVEDIQGRPQGDSYRSLSETGRGILLGFWLRPLSSTVWLRKSSEAPSRPSGTLCLCVLHHHHQLRPYGRGRPSKPDLRRIACQHSGATETARFQPIRSKYRMLCSITTELHPPPNEHPPFGLRWRKDPRMQGTVTVE